MVERGEEPRQCERPALTVAGRHEGADALGVLKEVTVRVDDGFQVNGDHDGVLLRSCVQCGQYRPAPRPAARRRRRSCAGRNPSLALPSGRGVQASRGPIRRILRRQELRCRRLNRVGTGQMLRISSIPLAEHLLRAHLRRCCHHRATAPCFTATSEGQGARSILPGTFWDIVGHPTPATYPCARGRPTVDPTVVRVRRHRPAYAARAATAIGARVTVWGCYPNSCATSPSMRPATPSAASAARMSRRARTKCIPSCNSTCSSRPAPPCAASAASSRCSAILRVEAGDGEREDVSIEVTRSPLAPRLQVLGTLARGLAVEHGSEIPCLFSTRGTAVQYSECSQQSLLSSEITAAAGSVPDFAYTTREFLLLRATARSVSRSSPNSQSASCCCACVLPITPQPAASTGRGRESRSASAAAASIIP